MDKMDCCMSLIAYYFQIEVSNIKRYSVVLLRIKRVTAKSITDLMKEEGAYTFLKIIRTAELEETLRHLKHFTVFAPSETAIYGRYLKFIENVFR